MKKLVFLLLILAPMLSIAQPQLTKEQAKYYNNFVIKDYNMKVDTMVNNILNTKLLRLKTYNRKDVSLYELQYKRAKFTVIHYKFVPYEQEEGWDYQCILENGRSVSLVGVYRIESVRPETLKRIKNIILEK